MRRKVKVRKKIINKITLLSIDSLLIKVFRLVLIWFLLYLILTRHISGSQANYLIQKKVAVTIDADSWSEPEITASWDKTSNHFSFEIINLEQFQKINYELTYQAGEVAQGVIGENKLENEHFNREIFLGTCSNEDCLAHQNISNFNLNILLEKENGELKQIEWAEK